MHAIMYREVTFGPSVDGVGRGERYLGMLRTWGRWFGRYFGRSISGPLISGTITLRVTPCYTCNALHPPKGDYPTTWYYIT